MGNVIDLRARRARSTVSGDACERFAAVVRAMGGRAQVAQELTDRLGWTVRMSMVAAWESQVAPPAEVLLAAEDLAATAPQVTPAGDRAVSGRVMQEDRTAGLEYPPTADTARRAATTLWEAMTRSQEPDPPWVSQAATNAGWLWHFDPPDRDVAGNGHRRVTSSDVARLREAMSAIVTLDRLFGGGHVQPYVLRLLTSQVRPLLEGRYSDRDGRAVFGVAAELTAQLAFSAYDAGRHGTAQSAYITSLRLAKAAGDRQLGLHVLANMATQAVGLGRLREAVQLASAASAGITRGTHPAVLAHVRTVEASAHAMAGDAARFRRALHDAERAVSKGKTDPTPQWARYFTPAHWAGTAIRGMRDLSLTRDALKHEGLALDLDGTNPRTHALHGALVATVHVAEGNVDRACELALVALDTTGNVQSERINSRLATLQRRLSPHRSVAGVGDIIDRINDRTTG